MLLNTNLSHFPTKTELQKTDMPSASRKLTEYFGAIVNKVVGDGTEVRCRRRPERKRCSGELEGTHWAEKIFWNCPTCNDNGVITEWQQRGWEVEKDESAITGIERAEITNDQHHMLNMICGLDQDVMYMVIAAKKSERGYVLEGQIEVFSKLRLDLYDELELKPKSRIVRSLLNRLD
jgi:hypothetical protein